MAKTERRRKSAGLPRPIELAVRAAEDKKAEDIVVLDLRKAGGFTDFFVICTGGNTRQIVAIADGVRDTLKRDLETARLAWADIRHAEDVLAAPSVAGRGTIVEVTDGDGEKRSVVRMPYRFSDADSGPVRGVPEPGEHTDDILRDWTGQPD